MAILGLEQRRHPLNHGEACPCHLRGRRVCEMVCHALHNLREPLLIRDMATVSATNHMLIMSDAKLSLSEWESGEAGLIFHCGFKLSVYSLPSLKIHTIWKAPADLESVLNTESCRGAKVRYLQSGDLYRQAFLWLSGMDLYGVAEVLDLLHSFIEKLCCPWCCERLVEETCHNDQVQSQLPSAKAMRR